METSNKMQTKNAAKKLSLINKIGLTGSVLLIFIAVFVMIGVKMNLFDDKSSSFYFLIRFPVILSPFIVLYAINKNIAEVVFRLTIGVFAVLVVTILTLVITGNVSFFLGDEGRNLLSYHLVISLMLLLAMSVLYLILISVKNVKRKK